MSKPEPRHVSLPFEPRVDGEPRRSVSSVNVRFEDKLVFKHLRSWWELEAGVPLTEWDAFSVMLHLVLTHPGASVPVSLAERRPVSALPAQAGSP